MQIILFISLNMCIYLLPLEHDRGQTDSGARSQRLSAAHHSHMVEPDWIQILRIATPTCV